MDVTVNDIYDFANNLLPSKFSFHLKVVRKLQGTGFDNVMKQTKVSNHFFSLIGEVVSNYNIDRRCIEFGRENSIVLFVGLRDVLRITGLPIDGSPVTGNEKIMDANKSGKEKAKELCFKYLGKFMESMNTEIKMSWLDKNFGHLSEDYDLVGEELEFNVRAAVLYVLGSIVVPNTSNTVSPFYLTFISDIDKIGIYAWGAAMLEIVHCSMQQILISNPQQKFGGRETKAKKTLYGNFHFVTMFILEHLLWVASRLLHPTYLQISNDVIESDKGNRPNDIPLLTGWHKRLYNLSLDTRNCIEDLVIFKKYFARLKAEKQVEWTLYARIPRYFLPDPFDMQFKLELAFTALISLEKVVIHDHGVQNQLQLSSERQGIKKELHKIFRQRKLHIKQKSRFGAKQDLTDVHKKYITAWTRRWKFLYSAAVGDVMLEIHWNTTGNAGIMGMNQGMNVDWAPRQRLLEVDVSNSDSLSSRLSDSLSPDFLNFKF